MRARSMKLRTRSFALLNCGVFGLLARSFFFFFFLRGSSLGGFRTETILFGCKMFTQVGKFPN